MKYLFALVLSLVGFNALAVPGSSIGMAPPVKDARLIFEREARVNTNGINVQVYVEYYMYKPELMKVGRKEEYAAKFLVRSNDGEEYHDQNETYVLNFGCEAFAGGVQEIDPADGEKLGQEYAWRYVNEKPIKNKRYPNNVHYMGIIANEICRAVVPNYDQERVEYMKEIRK